MSWFSPGTRAHLDPLQVLPGASSFCRQIRPIQTRFPPFLSPYPAAASGENWALRSKAALLLALVIRRMGAEVWDSALQRLLALAGEGPVYQGLVALVIKYVAEEITQASQDDIGVSVTTLCTCFWESVGMGTGVKGERDPPIPLGEHVWS